MRMLFLCRNRGGGAGTAQAVLRAWRSQVPELNINTQNFAELLMGSPLSKVGAVFHFLRRGGRPPLHIRKLRGAIERSPWYWERLSEAVEEVLSREEFDFSFAMGTILPVTNPTRPHFIYCDRAIRTNLYYPGGEELVRLRDVWAPYERRTIGCATMVFTMSQYTKKSLTEHYGLPPERSLCVRAGCNTPPPKEPARDRFHRQNILFIGVDWEIKGGPELVEAFSKIRRRHPRAMLTIVGCKPKVSAPGVEVVGRVPQERIPDYLARATVFCMPSWREGFGIVYIEAMRAGLPVISWNLGATPDFIIDGETGYKIQPGDVEMLAARLDELLVDPDKCREWGQRGRALVESRYTWETTVQEMYKAIGSALR